MEPPKKLINKILEFCFLLALCCLLINLAMHWILEVWLVLLVLAVAVAAITIIYRIWRHRHDQDLGKW